MYSLSTFLLTLLLLFTFKCANWVQPNRFTLDPDAGISFQGDNVQSQIGTGVVMLNLFYNDTNAPSVLIGTGNNEAYLIHSSLTAFSGSSISIADIETKNNGIRFYNSSSSGTFGHVVGSAGYFDDDKVEDFFITDWSFNSNTGRVFVFFGGKLEIFPTSSFDISNFDETHGVVIRYTGPGSKFGWSGVAIDINVDGLSDLAISAPDKGLVHVILGSANPVDLNAANDLTATNSVTIVGLDNNEFFGHSLGSVFNFHGQNFTHLIIGSPYTKPSGRAYVIFSQQNIETPIDCGNMTGLQGLRINPEGSDHNFGSAVSRRSGDYNGDGLGDILVSAPNATFSPAPPQGVVYIIWGSVDFPSFGMNLSTLTAARGIRIHGSSENEFPGQDPTSISDIGDFNGDGISDFSIGASENSFSVGRVYILYGNSTALTADFNLINMEDAFGRTFSGVTEQSSTGFSVFGGLDFHGNGMSDIIIGSPFENNTISEQGAVTLIYGSNSNCPTAYNGWVCSDCAPGSGGNGSFVCAPCSPGNSSDGTTMCTPCTPGSFSNTTALPQCRICDAGTFQPDVGATTPCQICPVGTSSPTQSSTCFDCSPGTFSASNGSSTCTTCPFGYFTDTFKSTACLPCPPGTAPSATYDACPPCQPGSFAPTDATPQCQTCPLGFFQNIAEQTFCIECAEGSVCNPGSTLPIPDYGWQNIDGEINLFAPCYPPEACPGGFRKCSLGYSPPENLCSTCSPTYYRLNGKCQSCPGSTLFIAGAVIAAYVLFLLVVIPLSSRGHRFGMFSSLFSFLQIMALFGYFRVDAHWVWDSTFSFLSTFIFNLELTAPECAGEGVNYYTLWILQITLPLITFTILWVYYIITMSLKRYGIGQAVAMGAMGGKSNSGDTPLNTLNDDSVTIDSESGSESESGNTRLTPLYYLSMINTVVHTAPPSKIRLYFYGSALFMTSLLYTIVTKSAISLLDCQHVHGSLYVIGTRPDIRCFTDEYNSYSWLAYIVLIFFSFGLPISIVAIFWFNKDIISDPSIRLVYGCFLDKYLVNFAFWEAISLVRKALILFATIMLTQYLILSIVFVFCVLLISIVVQYRFHPFWTTWLNKFELFSLFSCVITVILVFILGLNPQMDEQSKLAIAIINIFSFGISLLFGIYFGYFHVQDVKKIQAETSGIILTGTNLIVKT